jgi:kumamolisin
MMATHANLVPIHGTDLSPRPNSRVVGQVDPDEKIDLTIRLRARPSGPGMAGLERLVMELGAQKPAARKYLTPAEFDAKFGADEADIAKVEAFAKAHGFAVEASSVARRVVEISGPVGKLSEAFGVTLNLSKHQGQIFRERTGSVSVPSDLSEIVEAVFGFDNRRMAETQRRAVTRRSGVARAASSTFTPPQVAQLYDFPTGLDGSGECIGILEFGGGFSTDDLSTYFNGLGIAAPSVVAVSVDGTANNPGADQDADGEVMLDIEVAGAVAPKANIAVYFADFTVKGWVDALTTAVHDTTNNPSVISISWGFAENEPLDGKTKSTTLWTQAAVNTVNQALMAAATLGVTVTCAAGDDGSSDQFNDGKDHVDYPASSPYILSCGGTKLVGHGSTITSEVVWNEQAADEGATGGGISQLNPRPSYQEGLTLPKSKNSGSFDGRGLPDVSGDADPNTGYTVLSDGQQQIVGGTSAVAPLWAGLIALINQSLGAKAGFLNPLLYQTIGPDKVLKDITSGNNGDFKAGPGWDACTGWGSPDGQKLLTALSSSSSQSG